MKKKAELSGWEKYEILLDALGADRFLEELVRALSDYELSDNCDYIARNWDVDFEEEEY